MAALLAFLLLDWVFFTLIISGIIVITVLHEKETGLGWAHTLFVLIACLIAYKMDYTYQSIVENPTVFLKYIGMYVAAGVVWAFLKWFFYLKGISAGYDRIKKNAMSYYNGMSESLKSEKTLKDAIYERWQYEPNQCKGLKIKQRRSRAEGKGSQEFIIGYEVEIPTASDNKAIIVSWITHWPISAIWTVINDPIKKVINYIFEQIKGLFQKMSNRIFRNVQNDFN